MKRQKKSTLALIVMLIMTLTVLPACTKSDAGKDLTSETNGTSEEQITLRLTLWGSPREIDVNKKAVAKFEEKNPNVKVDMQFIPTDYDTKLTTMVAGNDEPDVAMMESGTIAYPLAEEGKFLNLQPYLENDPDISMDSLVPNITYSSEVGNIIGIAPGPESYALFYNEDAFKDAGLPAPPSKISEAWTWDEFVDVAKQLTLDNKGRNAADPAFDPKNIKQYGVNIGTFWGAYSNFIYSNGGDFISADGKTFAMNQPEAVEALQKLADLVNVHHVSPSPVQSKNIPATNVALQTRKVAMAVDGQWNTSALASSNFNFNVGVLPVMKEPVTTVVAGMFSVFKSTEHPEEAWELVKALIDPESSIDMLQDGVWMPALKSWYTDEALVSRWTDNLKSRPSGYKDAVIDVMLNYSHQTPTGYVKNFNKLMDVVTPALDKVWLGQQSAQEAMDAIADKAQAHVKGRRDIE
ncbi:carbohydrate ABC transporter substrate-binding protein, CUT1 family (TC 3.A.1.1.-) [Paenibacillus uliginis N3/975]|uniref:Carbohydrate ABC transporter substrate-binding protein, CUT1 family (TC 3.A.1.1.-) n=1 Tax=Paenibacillus uliginis N3/975 TaxID=1313296 RepID=A0A1X7HKE1_9BACL|nr:sugar ABC transporter substrate-binding protein [Paenibacillus uliginis]SMF87847.1 carbohydrate ABC transporter substrate-binding protein, CUT1 family (TC 3.A.1.1.-) [Paenibacillus uliginis N3/975]